MEEENKKNESPKKSEEKPKPRTRRTRKTTTASGKSEEQKTTQSKQSASRQSSAPKKEEQAEEEKEPANLVESIAYLRAIGLKKVSNKTFINEADLEAFLSEEFGTINKTKALGFIQILEREYPVKLQDLRKSYLEYYQQHKPKEPKELFVHAKGEPDPILKKYLVWVIAALLALGAIWYLMGDRESDLSKLESEDKTIVHDLNNDIVQKAEAHMAILEKNDTETAVAETVAPVTEKPKRVSERAVPFVKGASGNSTVLQQAVTQKSGTQEEKAVSAQKPQNEDEDIDLDAMVKQMVQEYNITDVAVMDTEANTTEQKKKEVVSEEVKPIAAKIVKPKADEKKAEKKRATVKQASKRDSVREQKAGQPKSIVNSKLYIVPKKKSWVGIIYLDDYTKKDFLIRKVLKLDPTRPQLIVVGHKNFEIYNNGYSYRFRGKGPVRFIYKNGDIMEINSREFRKYSKGVAW